MIPGYGGVDNRQCPVVADAAKVATHGTVGDRQDSRVEDTAITYKAIRTVTLETETRAPALGIANTLPAPPPSIIVACALDPTILKLKEMLRCSL